MSKFNSSMSRRGFLAGSTTLLAAPALAQTSSLNGAETVEVERDLSEVVRRNISSFRSLSWEPYFDTLQNGACLVDTTSRALHYWSEDQSIYKLYPTSVPLTGHVWAARLLCVKLKARAGARPLLCVFVILNGPTLLDRGQTTPLELTRFICLGHITVFTEPMTRAKLAEDHPTDASDFTMSI